MSQTGLILIVGPDRAIEQLLVELLTDAGYIASTVYDLSDALAVMVMVPPALLVLGIGHSTALSAALITQVHAVGLSRTPIVVLATDVITATSLLDTPGVVACLAQPFDLDEVLDCIARYVQPQTVELAARTVGG